MPKILTIIQAERFTASWIMWPLTQPWIWMSIPAKGGCDGI